MAKIKYRNCNEFFTIDDSDYKSVIRFSWIKNSKNYAIARNKKSEGGDGRIMSLQRFLLEFPENCLVDHKDGDTSNYRRNNLRVCNHSSNNRNRKINKGKTSIYRGVSFIKREKKFSAQITINKVKKHLGYFNDELEAALTYDKVIRKIFGNEPEFAKLNFWGTKL
jgi:hypothetical protein